MTCKSKIIDNRLGHYKGLQVDDLLSHLDDKPSIGMILRKDRNKFIAEYALRDTHKPIGVAEYITAESLPDQLKGCLPTI